MKSRRYEKILVHESGILIYESDGIKIYKEPNGNLYFESDSMDLKTNDCAEGVAALLRMKSMTNDSKLWNIQLDNRYNVSAENVLYWITGGDKEWAKEDNKMYKYKWEEVCDIFTHKYSDKIYKIIDNSETLGDIRSGFIKNLNLNKIYEFSLDNGLI